MMIIYVIILKDSEVDAEKNIICRQGWELVACFDRPVRPRQNNGELWVFKPNGPVMCSTGPVRPESAITGP